MYGQPNATKATDIFVRVIEIPAEATEREFENHVSALKQVEQVRLAQTYGKSNRKDFTDAYTNF